MYTVILNKIEFFHYQNKMTSIPKNTIPTQTRFNMKVSLIPKVPHTHHTDKAEI